MYVLVVLACLKTDPTVCTSYELGVIPDRSAETCQINNRQRVRAWAIGQAGLALHTWTCREQPTQEG